MIGLAAGLVWYLIARDRPEEHPWVKPAEARVHSLGDAEAGAQDEP